MGHSVKMNTLEKIYGLFITIMFVFQKNMWYREGLVSLLFGADGLATSGDDETLDNRMAMVMQFIRQNNIDAVAYVHDRIIPKIANNCRLMWNERWLGQQQWTNNNCESINHVLKMKLDWKPARLTDLVEHLREQVRHQYRELQRALGSQGI